MPQAPLPPSLFLWNARSVVNKLDYVQSLFTSKCIGITETWLNSKILDSEFVPSG